MSIKRISDLLKKWFAVIWLVSPLLFYLPINPRNDVHFLSGLLIVSVATLLLPAAWVKTTDKLLLSLSPLALLSGFISAYLLFYQSPVSVGLLQSLLQTNRFEFMEQAARLGWIAAICILGWLAYLYCVMTLSEKTAIPLRGLLAAISLWVIMVVSDHLFMDQQGYEEFNRQVGFSFIRKAFPLNLAFVARDLHEAGQVLERPELLGNTKLPPPPVSHKLEGSERQVFVFVIGESAQWQVWEELDTTLRPLPNLIYYGNDYGQANLTYTSVPLMTAGAVTTKELVRLPSLIEWQHEAGCTTVVYSNNSEYNFSAHADIREIRGDRRISVNLGYDHDFLPMVKALLDNQGLHKLCITLHTVGSHQRYRERYTTAFARYPTEGLPEKIGTVNAYRNTILYYQDFLHQLIDILNAEKGSAFLAFASDHGENLFEINNLREHMTETPTEYEIRVPMLFWANQRFIRDNPDKWKQLAENRNKAVSNVNMFPTIMDAMGMLEDALKFHPYKGSLMRPHQEEPRTYYTPDMKQHSESELLRGPVTGRPN